MRRDRAEPSCVRFGGRARKSCMRWKRFRPLPYEPFARRLVALDRPMDTGNTLYVRPSPALDQRLWEAPAARVVGVSV